MTQFRKKPVVITAITFDQLVSHGTEQCKAEGRQSNIVNGMPWSFSYAGHPITHENDDCYLIPTPEGTMKMGRDDMLITGVKGEIYPCKRDIFEATYDSAPADLEREIQANASKGPRVTPFEVEAHIRSEFYFTAEQGVLGESELGTRPASWTNLDQVTICVLILTNGTKIVGVNEGPVSRENFKADLGRQYARQKAVDQIWPLLGFRLRDELARPALTDADAAADLAGTPRPDNPTADAADFLASVKACDLSGDTPCEACQ